MRLFSSCGRQLEHDNVHRPLYELSLIERAQRYPYMMFDYVMCGSQRQQTSAVLDLFPSHRLLLLRGISPRTDGTCSPSSGFCVCSGIPSHPKIPPSSSCNKSCTIGVEAYSTLAFILPAASCLDRTPSKESGLRAAGLLRKMTKQTRITRHS